MDFEQLTKDAMGKAIEIAVQETIRQHWGYGNDDEIKMVIKDHARKIIEESDELKQLIFDALKSWINNETASDVRQAREENAKRYGRG
jgi:hypothetical protein